MSTPPLEIAVRMAVIASWMDVAKFIALKTAVDHKLARAA